MYYVVESLAFVLREFQNRKPKGKELDERSPESANNMELKYTRK